VTASYSFAGLADYQYLGVDTRHQQQQQQRDYRTLSERNRPQAAEPFKVAQPLLLVPPIFSKVDMPVAFAFKDQAPSKGEQRNCCCCCCSC
jgi:general transcription factor 3C polypeptide 5 (transcription factor C subunit 1)